MRISSVDGDLEAAADRPRIDHRVIAGLSVVQACALSLLMFTGAPPHRAPSPAPAEGRRLRRRDDRAAARRIVLPMHRAAGVPNLGEYADPHVLVELATLAERAGWDGFFIWDHLVPEAPETPAADPQIAVAAIAAATSRIRIGALLTPLPRRRPHKVARETITLDRLSRGRLIFGAALGWSGEREYEAFGEDGDARLRGDRLDEALEVLALLWSGESVDHAGEHYAVRDIRFEPHGRVPVWIGGGWPARRPFRRAARWDGVFPIVRGAPHEATMTPGLLSEIVAYTLEHRPPGLPPIDVIMEGNSDGDRAPLAAYEPLTWYVEKLGWWRGGLGHVRDRIRRGPPST